MCLSFLRIGGSWIIHQVVGCRLFTDVEQLRRSLSTGSGLYLGLSLARSDRHAVNRTAGNGRCLS